MEMEACKAPGALDLGTHLIAVIRRPPPSKHPSVSQTGVDERYCQTVATRFARCHFAVIRWQLDFGSRYTRGSLEPWNADQNLPALRCSWSRLR